MHGAERDGVLYVARQEPLQIERIPPIYQRPPGRGPRLRTSFALVALVLVASPWALSLWTWWSSAPAGLGGWLHHTGAALLVACVGALFWHARLYRTLISLPFSVSLLSVLLLATILGTVVLQNGAAEEYSRRYGALAPLLLRLGIDDLFHTTWFQGLLMLLALSLILVGTRRAVWRLSMMGHMLCHLGVVVVLVGGFVGQRWGYRGMIDAHEGQSFAQAWTTERGVPTGERQELGFVLRLNDFEIDRYEPEYRLYVYAQEGDSFRRTRSFGVDDAQDWTQLDEDFQFRIRAAYPDFHVLAQLREAPDGKGAPALAVVGPDGTELRLLSGIEGRAAAYVAPGDTLLRLVQQAPDAAALDQMALHSPERHRITFLDPETAEHRTLNVQLGESYDLAPGIRLHPLEFLPDFVFDTESRRARSRTREPNNPALRVVLTDGMQGDGGSENWLFANMPDYREAHGATGEKLGIAYGYDPPHAPIAHEILVVAAERQAWLLDAGIVREQVELPHDGSELPGLAGTTFRFFDSAVEHLEPATRSMQWRNPTLELEYRHEGRVGTQLLAANHGDPLWLPGRENVLIFEAKPNDVRSYRSRVEILVDGEPVDTATIEVNSPLSFGGYHIYQSNYREEDPTYSGFLVVRDPGFKAVFLGFLMMSLGVVFVYYVRPRLSHGGRS